MAVDESVSDQKEVTDTVPVHLEFEVFYEREIDRVVGLAFVISGSRSGAEDIAQDAFLAAYRRWDRVGAYENPGAWIRTTVANRAVSVFRRKKAEAKALVRFGGSATVVPELSPDSTATWAAVRRLPKRQAQVIALRYYDGSSVVEIARMLGCSESTVKTHIQRARQTLESQLGERNQP